VDNDADLALVERCRRGDWSAFSELVVRYQRPIYNAAFWVLRRPEDAKDITQIVFLKVAERLGMTKSHDAELDGHPVTIMAIDRATWRDT